MQKPERCASRAFAASSTGRAWRSCPLGTKLSAEPRTRRKAARTLSALNFPVCVPTVRACRPVGTFLTVCLRVGSGAEGMKCMICMIFRLCMVCRKPSFRAIMQTMQIMQNVQTMQGIEIMQIMQNVPIHAGYRNHANHADHAGHAKVQKTARFLSKNCAQKAALAHTAGRW